MSRSARDQPLAAIMGPGAHYEGDLAFEGRVRVDGHFTGRIYSEELLEVGPDGHVEGSMDVAQADVAGRLTGDIRVRERLVLRSTAVVVGKLDVGILDLRPGARIEGEIRVQGVELP